MQLNWITVVIFVLYFLTRVKTVSVSKSSLEDLVVYSANEGEPLDRGFDDGSQTMAYDSDTVLPSNLTDDEDTDSSEKRNLHFLSKSSVPLNDSIPLENEEDESVDEVVPENSSDIPNKNKSESQPENNSTCGEPPTIPNGYIEQGLNPSYSIGDVITYRCEFGFTTEGSVQNVQCMLSEITGIAQWSNPQISCRPRSCGHPGSVENGYRIGSLFTFPNSISYECDNGFKIKGNGIRYCQTNGRWSGSLPSCERIYCDPPRNIENGRVIFSSLEFGSELRYECNPGFRVKKHDSRFCSANGTWSGKNPVCQDSLCEHPQAPEHGSVRLIGDKASVDSRALYTCDGGRTLKGSKISICLENGEWTFPTPQCLEPCAVPEVLHGRIGKYERRSYNKKHFRELSVGTSVKDGEELYLFCEHKYEPLGRASIEEKLSCTKGEWTDYPRCEPARCRGPPPVVPKSGFLAINRHHGGSVSYKCYTHHHKTPGNVTCDFGDWKGKPPVCTDTRCFINSISFPGVLSGSRKEYKSGESFVPACDSNHMVAKANNRLTCESGTWIGHLPPCTGANCLTEPPLIEHGTWQPYSNMHGSIVTYECDEQFQLVESSSKVQCLFGKWEGKSPSCKDSQCYMKDLVKTEGIVLEDTVTPNNKFLKPKCIEGYSYTGVDPFCSKGIWTHSTASCKESKCSVYQILNGAITERTETQQKRKWSWKYDTIISYKPVTIGIGKSPGSSLYVSCNPGYSFQGKDSDDVEIKCKGGKWTPRPLCLLTGSSHKEESTTRSLPSLSTLKQALVPTEPSVIKSKESQKEKSCSCTYLSPDNNLVGYVNNQLLENGKTVEDGFNVQFHCINIGHYRLQGESELECKGCRDWHSSEYPQCALPERGDSVLDLHGDGYTLPGGLFGINLGQNYRISCVANGVATYPQWRGPAGAKNIQIEYRTELVHNFYVYINVLHILDANMANNGRYECTTQGYRSKEIHIKVMDPSISCPEFTNINHLTVNYDNGQAVNSRATFSCKDKKKVIVGCDTLMCLSDGQWSGNPPECKSPIQCPKFVESGDLTIKYNQGLDVGSIAEFHCFFPRRLTGALESECNRNGQWSNPVPSCLLPSCSLDALFKVLPENVEPIMENVNNDTLPYNFTVRLTCGVENLALRGSDVATCGEDGEWKVSSVQCVPGCSPLRKEDRNLYVEPEKDFYRIGDLITLSCPKGLILSADIIRLMCLGPQWTESEIPHCQPKPEESRE